MPNPTHPDAVRIELTRDEAEAIALSTSYVLATIKGTEFADARSGRNKLRAALAEKELGHAS